MKSVADGVFTGNLPWMFVYIGGLGLSMFEQMIIWEQLGRVTNALCWCFSEAQDWMTWLWMM